MRINYTSLVTEECGFAAEAENSVPNFWQINLGATYKLTNINIKGHCSDRKFINDFKLKYTDDIKEWISDDTVYSLTTGSSFNLIELKTPIDAQYFRFYNNNSFTGDPVVIMELIGSSPSLSKIEPSLNFPLHISSSSEKNNQYSADMALKNHQNFWCISIKDIDAWWFSDFGSMYIIERINVYMKDSIFDKCENIIIYQSTSNSINLTTIHKVRNIPNALLINYTIFQVKLDCEVKKSLGIIFATPPLRLRYIKINLKNSNGTCLRFEFYGKEASHCPPGSARSIDKCYSIINMDTTREKVNNMCKLSFNWNDNGFMPMPKSAQEMDFIIKLKTLRLQFNFSISFSLNLNVCPLSSDSQTNL